jgi:hypothetical protein
MTQDARFPPGWYADPGNSERQRYWDGSGWIGDSVPAAGTASDGGSSPSNLIGSLVIAGGLLWAAAWALIPASVSVLGFSGSCGLPFFDAFVRSNNSLDQQCSAMSMQHLFVGGGVALVAVITGSVLRSSGRRVQVNHLVLAPPPLASARGFRFLGISSRGWLVALIVLVSGILIAIIVVRLAAPSTTAASGDQPTPVSGVSEPPSTVAAIPHPSPPLSTIGYGTIKIGMSSSALCATGTTITCAFPQDGSCNVALKYPGAQVWLDPTVAKVVGIDFGPGMSTSKGVRIGSSVEQLKTVYPNLNGQDAGNGVYTVPISSDTSYYFAVGSNSSISQITLMWDGQQCAG